MANDRGRTHHECFAGEKLAHHGDPGCRTAQDREAKLGIDRGGIEPVEGKAHRLANLEVRKCAGAVFGEKERWSRHRRSQDMDIARRLLPGQKIIAPQMFDGPFSAARFDFTGFVITELIAGAIVRAAERPAKQKRVTLLRKRYRRVAQQPDMGQSRDLAEAPTGFRMRRSARFEGDAQSHSLKTGEKLSTFASGSDNR
ncbi:hypothetical protein [Sphingopyxis sp. FD7]|uniref:hypothetical protein n=1 Tax=Sphingopyxis sp. FD7 TaxID=1914525 RepID=UPI001559A545|nr:hypothetical protein [Sphingopyxis sp. FD7]MBN8804848.1 hypothetical protein [Sphingopyxis terrae]